MSDISQIKLPDNTTYNINAKTVNGHTVDKDVPSNAVFTDQYVAQVSSLTEDNNYRVLLSGSASDNTQTESVRKSPAIKINPKYDAITMGYDRASGSAYGVCSLTQGSNIVASGQYSHGEGWWTIANHRSQHVFGEYNIADTNSATVSNRGNYVEIVGNGTENSRSNARTLDWSGNETLAGSLRLAGTTSDIHLTGTDNYWYGTTTSLKTAVSSLEHDLSDLTPLEKTASGAIAKFDDGSALPMPKLEVAIEPQQDLHGYEAPWVGGAGKNKLQNTLTTRTYNGVTATVRDDGTVVLNGTATQDTDFFLNSSLSLSGNYIVNGCPSGGTDSTYFLAVEVNGRWTSTGREYGSGLNVNGTINGIAITIVNGTTCNNLIFKPMIRLSTVSDSTFTPYSNICPISGWDEVNITVADDLENPTVSNVYTIDLDGTRYGGTLDVVNGVLTVDRVGVDLSSVSFTYDSSNKRWSRQFSDMKSYSARSAELMFEQYQATTSAYTGDTGTAFTYGKDIYIYDANQSLTISGKCVYELATPLTIQLTPTQVKSLLGTNNVWADTGDVKELIYFRNAKSTQAIKDIIDTTTAKDIAFTKYKGLPTNVQEAINQTYDNVIALNENMADYYLERQSYSVDDYVRYEDPYYGGYNLYRCIERSDGGSFDYNKWTRVNIGDEFSQIKQSLSNLVKSTIISGTTTASGALSLPSNLLGKPLVDCHYKKDTNIGLVYRRDYYYLTCLAASMNPFANTQVDVEVFYLDV